MLPTVQQPVAVSTDRLRAAAMQFMSIEDMTLGEGKDFAVRFRGRLMMDSTQAYALAAESFRPLGYTPLFRKEGDTHVVLAVAGTINPGPSRVWINYLMFGLTVLSVWYSPDRRLRVDLVAERGRLIAGLPLGDRGTMAAVAADRTQVAKHLAGLADVVVANVNHPSQTVISGTHAAVDRALERFF